ncbi:MAG: tRNA lysidine(34) synthetase TilS [Chloroflexi bacterium HGW-Chloroflexi-3]|nr:MAG: tRNA lysidine(34) synthetase TilS [Chloroflexi bacterium HGW-Chloroflexi-3]
MDLRFLNIIENNIKLTNTQPVVIAFSGGMDSVCLLNLLTKLENPIIIAHFNHGIRENADRDEQFARMYAQQLGVDFVSEKSDVKVFAKENHLSLEEAGRKKRYDFLFRIARDKGAHYIAVGHHADDQVETLFMHLMRGSGLTGLAGMKEIALIPEFDLDIKIIRPLLSFWRYEIEEYCAKNNLDYVVDETNFTNLYERNRIRHEILPFLNERYSGLNQRLLNLANVLQSEDELIQVRLSKMWKSICLQQHPRFIRLDLAELKNQPLGLQRRIIRFVAFSLRPELRDLSFKNIENLLNFMNKNKTGEIDLQDSLIALFTNQEVLFGSKSKDWIGLLFPQVLGQFKMEIGKCDYLEISENWLLQFELINDLRSIQIKTENDFTVFLNGDKISEFIILRGKKDGDKFQPLGMKKGSIKLSDFFINEKVMQAAREKWPLVINSDGRIIWVPGIRPGHEFRVTDSTKNFIKMSVMKKIG